MPDHAPGAAYFLYHSIGQYAGKAAEMAAGLTDFAKAWGREDDAQWGYALGVRSQFLDRWRQIINAPKDTLTTSESVTTAISQLVTALPHNALKGKRFLVAGDCFPSLHFLLTGLQERLGFTLDTVPLRQGATWVEDQDMIDRWGPDVGVALLTWVSSTSSHRIDPVRYGGPWSRYGQSSSGWISRKRRDFCRLTCRTLPLISRFPPA